MKFNGMNLVAFFAVVIALSIYMNIFTFSDAARLVVFFLLGFLWTPITGLPIVEEIKETDKKS